MNAYSGDCRCRRDVLQFDVDCDTGDGHDTDGTSEKECSIGGIHSENGVLKEASHTGHGDEEKVVLAGVLFADDAGSSDA